MRRLDELNHAHAQAQERNRSYIPRETFEQKMDSLQSSTDARDAEIERQIERIRAAAEETRSETYREIDKRASANRDAIDGVKKLLYMGVGIVLALQGLLWLFMMLVDNMGGK